MSWLAIDLGTSSVKVLVISDTGEVISSASHSYPTLQPEPGAAEQDPAAWWAATVQAINDVGPARNEVRAIGLSGQMHGTVLIDRQGSLLHPAIIWSDIRGTGALDRINAEIGMQTIVDEIGSPLATGFQAVTLAWLRETQPNLLNRVDHVLLPKDWLRFRLTGEWATEPSDGASTGLHAVRSRNWSDSAIGWTHADRNWFPPVSSSNAIVGQITARVAEETGLEKGLPVVTGGGDAPLAAIASGVASRSAVLLTLSSGAQVTRFVDQPVIDQGGRMHTFGSPLNPDAGEAGWYAMGATMVAGSALHWLRDAILATGRSVPDLLEAADAIPAGSDGLLFLPYLSGERTPHMDPVARGAFFGLTANHTWHHMVRAVVEGSIFALLDAFETMLDLTGPADTVVLAGGSAKSGVWQQSVANIFGRSIIPSSVSDQSAVGAAVLAASAVTGQSPIVIADEWSAFGDPIEPSPAAQRRLADLRPIFQSLYTMHRNQFPILSGPEC
jgi:xylulokinase